MRPLPWLALLLAGLAHGMALAEDLEVGMSAAFTGPSRALGIELYRGSHAYLEKVNRAGGVHGRRIVIRAYDDAYHPPQAIQNTIRLVKEDRVFLLFNYVGTPTVTRVLPLLKHFSADHVYLFFPFTGAEPQRQPPYSDFVFNLRASYLDETRGLVDRFVDAGRDEVAIFYQADAYGRSGWEGVKKALADHGLEISAEATYRRGSSFLADYRAQVAILSETAPDAIICVCSYAACAGFVRDVRAVGWDVPIANLSFVAIEAMAELLASGRETSGNAPGRRLINAQVVPSYEDLTLEAVREYRALMDTYGDAVPVVAADTGYRPLRYSFVSFEGFLNAKLLVELLRRMGPDPGRQRIHAAAEAMGEVDLGIDQPVRFGADRHQASDRVYFTTLEDGRFVPVSDWAAWTKVAQ